MNKHITLKHRQHGYVSKEVLLSVLGVLMLGLGGLISATGVLDDANNSVSATGTSSMVPKIQKKFVNASSFAGLDTGEAIKMGVVPRDMQASSTVIRNRFGGSVAIAVVTISSTNDAFSITSPRLPSTACYEHVNDMFDVSRTIVVGTTTVKANGATSLNPATVSTACNNASNTAVSTHTKS